MQKALIIVALVVMSGCADKAPPSLSPAGVKVWQANEALLVLDTVQKSAIGLNKIQKCTTPDVCTPLLSDNNTEIVINAVASGVRTIRAVPDGWKASTTAALNEISQRLDAAGKTVFVSYVSAAAQILAGI